MLHSFLVYLALVLCGVGLVYRAAVWFRGCVGIEGQGISTPARVMAAARGILGTVFSSKVFILIRVFLLDGIFLARTLRRDFYRWLMHSCIFGGFMVLLLMHALEKFVTLPLFPTYQSTLNPFMFIRDFAGAAVFLGAGMAVCRRFFGKGRRPASSAMDAYAITIVSVVILSGFALEAVKITSQSVFRDMVEEYVVGGDGQETKALEAYWVQEFGVVSGNVKGPFDVQTLETGRALHEMSCQQCHSRPHSAFAGYIVSRAIAPAAGALDRANARTVLWWMHFLACLFGLAYLPFSKMLHLFATPLSLVLNAVMKDGVSDPANVATKQMIELDACTHCGACTAACSVAGVFPEIGNPNILPSEKIASLKALAAGRKLDASEIRTIQDGLHLCTNCNRCTDACPAGIGLRDLWFGVRERLLREGIPELLLLSPFALFRGIRQESVHDGGYLPPVQTAMRAVSEQWDAAKARDVSIPLEPGEKETQKALNAAFPAGSFSNCYCCVTCSNSCPVVRNYENPKEVLAVLPHQVMHAVGLSLWDLVFSSGMLWNCLGCYQCQENCPQGVRVADILYELKNVAVARAGKA
ncbi:MAG: 4Fe-4S dicluster domain-containing protein [Syntrophobacteraceae bacterium]|nr:4Fe-4S dicluster domain-containing protein [Desulfobacteraceae bacterium]